MAAPAQQQQQQLPDHIQFQVDKDTAHVPSFHGNYKDAVTLQAFINRIDMGVETLRWTQNIAFTYFSNALKDVAAAWLECYITDHPLAPKTWAHYKPELRKAFGDTTDPVIFAQEVSNLRPEQFAGSLFRYHAAIARTVTLHQEEFTTPPLPQLPDDHNLTEDQLEMVNQLHHITYTTAVQNVHSKLRKEFFLNGLPKKQLEMVVNKPFLNTVHEMIAYIHQQESIATKKNSNNALPTTTTPTIQSVQTQALHEEPTTATNYIQNSNRSTTTQPQRGGVSPNYRGNNPRGYTTNNNRGNNRGYRGGGNSQNNCQNNSSSSFASKMCIFCRKPGHLQEDCFSRIEKNEPCISNQGKTYFPKVNATEDSVSASSVFFLEN